MCAPPCNVGTTFRIVQICMDHTAQRYAGPVHSAAAEAGTQRKKNALHCIVCARGLMPAPAAAACCQHPTGQATWDPEACPCCPAPWCPGQCPCGAAAALACHLDIRHSQEAACPVTTDMLQKLTDNVLQIPRSHAEITYLHDMWTTV